MSGLATNKRIGSPRRRRLTTLAPAGAPPARATGLAPAWVMPPGTGLTIPRLDGIPQQYHYRRGEQKSARVAVALLRAGVAKADDWQGCAGNPGDFLKRTLDRWVADHGGEQIRQEFHLHLSLTTLTDYAPHRDDDGHDPDIYLALEPESAGYVVLGPTLRLLEREHPRLPVTFVHLFTRALNRWVRVWDWRDALDRVDRLREWYETDIEAGEVELPDMEHDIPPCMKRRPLSVSSLRRLDVKGSTARDLVASVLELEALLSRTQRPEFGQDRSEIFADCGEPLPALLAVFEKHDAIEGQFDEESQGMLELTPEPNWVASVDVAKPDSILRSFAALAACCSVLSLAVRILNVAASIVDTQSISEAHSADTIAA